MLSPTSYCGPDKQAPVLFRKRVPRDLFLTFSISGIICHPSTSALERNMEIGNIRSKQISAGPGDLKLQIVLRCPWQMGSFSIKATVAVGATMGSTN